MMTSSTHGDVLLLSFNWLPNECKQPEPPLPSPPRSLI